MEIDYSFWGEVKLLLEASHEHAAYAMAIANEGLDEASIVLDK